MLDARAGQFGLARRPRDARGFDGFLRTPQAVGGGRTPGRHALHFDAHVAGLGLELRQRFGDPVACRRGVLQRVTQRRRRVDRRKDLAAGGFDVGFEPFDLAVRRFVGLGLGGQRGRRTIAFGVGLRSGAAAPGERGTGRLTPRPERQEFAGNSGAADLEGLHLLAVELDLLLLPVDRKLAGVRRLARLRRLRFGLELLDAAPGEIGLDLGDAGRRHRFALPGVGQPGAGRCDRLGQLAVLPREKHLLPPPHLVAELLVTLRFRGLALQGPALLLDFEHDVVDAGEVLLRRVELQLRRAPSRLVFRHARRFLDQLTPVGRPRAEDHPDLALLDDRVSLRPEARVHQQVVDIPQTARLAVNQVLALAGPVEPSRDLDLARDRLDDLLAVLMWRRVFGVLRRPARAARHRNRRALVDVAAAVPVGRLLAAVAIMVVVGVERGTREMSQHPTEPQTHLRRGRRLARVAAVEDDVFHALAAQALGALFAHHPRDRVGDVALAAPVGADNRRHPLVEGELGAVGERLESVDL